MEKQAQIALDPVFGDIQDHAVKASVRTQKSTGIKPPGKPQTRGSSFVTTVTSSVTDNADTVIPKKTQRESEVAQSPFKVPCMFCKEAHKLAECNVMMKAPNKDRMEFIKAK